MRHNQRMKETDDIIIERVKAGDKNAYAIIVDRYKDKVYSLVLGIVRNEETAKELAQDIFIKAYSALKKFRKESSFSTWIYRIAYNTAISETRKNKQKVKSFDEQLEKASSMSISDTFEEEEKNEMRKSILNKAIKQLKDEERLILMLYYFEEQSVEEISQSSGLSQSNVKVKLFRLRNKLKEIMTRMGKTEVAFY